MKDPVTNIQISPYRDIVFWKTLNTYNWRNLLLEESLYEISRTLDGY